MQGHEDKVVKVERQVFALSGNSALEQGYMVLAIGFGGCVFGLLGEFLRRICQQECLDVFLAGHRLGLVESLKETFHCRLLPVKTVLLVGLLGDVLHVLLVQHLEGLRITQSEYLLPQEFHAEGMDGTYEICGVLSADQSADPVSHLLGGLVGECKAQNISRVNAEFVDKVCISVCQYPCLSRSRSCNDPDPAFGRLYRFCLLVIQSSEFHVILSLQQIYLYIYSVAKIMFQSAKS